MHERAGSIIHPTVWKEAYERDTCAAVCFCLVIPATPRAQQPELQRAPESAPGDGPRNEDLPNEVAAKICTAKTNRSNHKQKSTRTKIESKAPKTYHERSASKKNRSPREAPESRKRKVPTIVSIRTARPCRGRRNPETQVRAGGPQKSLSG